MPLLKQKEFYEATYQWEFDSTLGDIMRIVKEENSIQLLMKINKEQMKNI